jgi:hypothetical protein
MPNHLAILTRDANVTADLPFSISLSMHCGRLLSLRGILHPRHFRSARIQEKSSGVDVMLHPFFFPRPSDGGDGDR